MPSCHLGSGFFFSDYCLLLAVAEGNARVACVAHLVTVSMNQVKCCKCIIKHSVNALFIGSLCEMGNWNTETLSAQKLDLKRSHKCGHTLTMYNIEEIHSHVTYHTFNTTIFN